MRRFLFMVAVVGGLLVLGQPPIPTENLRAGYQIEGRESAASTRGGSVLFSTFSGITASPFTISSQNFTDAGFQSQGADDFTVTGNGWTIETIEVRGTYFEFSPGGPTGPANSVNVYILGNSGTLPDTTNLSAGAIYAAENISYSDVAFGDFRVPLPGAGVTLLPGTYWLVVQANMGVLAGGQWGWTESSSAPNSGVPAGFESAWFQTIGAIPPANGGGFTCVGAWGRRITDCDITVPADPNPPPEFDLAFQLEGTILPPGITVNPTSLTTSEAGVSDSFDVFLTAPPIGGNSVDVPIGPPNPAEGMVSPTMLTYTAANWDIPQTVTVNPVDDAIADGDVMYTLVNGPISSGDPAYNGMAVADVAVVNQDDESVGVTVSPVSGVQVSEDGLITDTVDINLNTAPGAGETISIPISISDPAVATLDQSVLMFTGTSPQTVTVSGIDDDIDQGDLPFTIVTGDPSSTSPGSPYDMLTATDVADVSATRIDDDTAGVTVTAAGGEPIITDEAGTMGTISVVLESEPTNDVTVTCLSSDTSEGTLMPMSLMFTAANWDTPQDVTVTGQDDDIDDGNVGFTVLFQPVSSMDLTYQGIDPADVACINNDDADTAGFTISPLSGLVTSEGGMTDTFTVVLDTQPVFFVDLPLSSSDTTEGLIATDGVTFGPSATLSFNSANWNLPQTVTVQGQDDPVDADGDILFQIITGDPVSGDAPYDILTAGDVPDVEVTNTDDDGPAGITVDPLNLMTFEDPTQPAATFTVSLDTAPTENVSIDVASSNLAEGTVDTATLVFTPAGLGAAQTVTVQGVDDNTIEGDQNYTILLSPAVSADLNYAGLDPDDVAVINVDDDFCGPVVIECEIGGVPSITGTPFCVIDFYRTNGSDNPLDWTLLAAGITIGPDGIAIITGVVCEQDSIYLVTESGNPDNILSSLLRTIPTLSQWGLMSLMVLLAFGAIVAGRRARTTP